MGTSRIRDASSIGVNIDQSKVGSPLAVTVSDFSLVEKELVTHLKVPIFVQLWECWQRLLNSSLHLPIAFQWSLQDIFNRYILCMSSNNYILRGDTSFKHSINKVPCNSSMYNMILLGVLMIFEPCRGDEEVRNLLLGLKWVHEPL